MLRLRYQQGLQASHWTPHKATETPHLVEIRNLDAVATAPRAALVIGPRLEIDERGTRNLRSAVAIRTALLIPEDIHAFH